MTGRLALFSAVRQRLRRDSLMASVLPATAARRASRGVCPAARSVALPPIPARSPAWENGLGRVIGMDPHKRSATIEIIDEHEQILTRGRVGADRDGYRAILNSARQYPDRGWAVEGCRGIGRRVAQRLVAEGETVVDVPAKLSARARVFTTGQGRKTDRVDADSVAVVALRTTGLRQVCADGAAVALRLLVDRRDELGRAPTETSAACTSSCLNSSPAVRSSSGPPRRPARCWPPCDHVTSSGGLADSWRRS